MPNVKAIINGHNKKVLSERPDVNERLCNCRNPNLCPLNGHCLTPEIMYEANVTSDLPRYKPRKYKGVTERFGKERIKEHRKTFTNRRKEGDSELSKEIWRIKDAGGTPEVSWRILKKARSYNPQSKKCLLCLTEKLAIAEHKEGDLLNKRSEIVAKCRHLNKYCLSQIDSND